MAGWDLTNAACPTAAPSARSSSVPVRPSPARSPTPSAATSSSTRSPTPPLTRQTSRSTRATATSLTDAAAPDDSGALVPGTYSVSEAAVAGWDLGAIVCDECEQHRQRGARTATIHLDPGETVKCTFTNVKRGTITIIKDAVPNDRRTSGSRRPVPACRPSASTTTPTPRFQHEGVLEPPRRALLDDRVGGRRLGSHQHRMPHRDRRLDGRARRRDGQHDPHLGRLHHLRLHQHQAGDPHRQDRRPAGDAADGEVFSTEPATSPTPTWSPTRARCRSRTSQ